MWIKIFVRVGIVMVVGMFLFAVFKILLGVGALYLFLQLYQSSPSPKPPTPPTTVIPQGYHGVAIICSVTPPSGMSQTLVDKVTVPSTGTVRVLGVRPATRWVFSDGSDVSFVTPLADETNSVYATQFDSVVPGGKVWIICIGNHDDHKLYEPQEKELLEKFVAQGCPAEFVPPHSYAPAPSGLKATQPGP
jgi:hypothetical protein